MLGEGKNHEGGGGGDAMVGGCGLSKVTAGGPLTCLATPPLSLSLSLLSPPLPQPLALWQCAHVPAPLHSG